MSSVSMDERRVLVCAAWWWRMHRPIGWTIQQHRANPGVNTQSPSEDALAKAIAALPRMPR